MTLTAADSGIVRLCDLRHGQEAECFAALARRELGLTKKNEPFVRCYFRDKRVTVEAPLWADSRYHNQAKSWVEGVGYRLRVRLEIRPKYGPQIEIFDIRRAGPADEADGYDFNDLVESTHYRTEDLLRSIHDNIEKYVTDPALKQLVNAILEEHGDLFKKIQAAANFHHGYTGGLLEHVWSMTRITGFLAAHYSKYYSTLNPVLNQGVIVAATVLHDIGKLRELEYNPVEARYTKEGSLIGHVLMGRDMVREAARRIDGFPEETLLLLEHAILAHHGKREYGAPIVPQTIEALIVSFVDDLDAKINVAARERLRSTTEGDFTDRLFPLDNRRIYKGVPVEPPCEEDDHVVS